MRLSPDSIPAPLLPLFPLTPILSLQSLNRLPQHRMHRHRTSAPHKPSRTGPSGTQVSMSTLKEMFRPQDRASTSGVTAGFSLGLGAGGDVDAAGGDSGGGFSLMDSLGLEFELEEEEPEQEFAPSFAPSLPAMGYSRFPQPATPSMQERAETQQKKLGPFFPSSTNSSSWNGADSQGSVQRWLKPRSEEERERDWSRYKEELTKVIKKRHREAARKHKRNFKSMPQQVNQANAAAGGPDRAPLSRA